MATFSPSGADGRLARRGRRPRARGLDLHRGDAAAGSGSPPGAADRVTSTSPTRCARSRSPARPGSTRGGGRRDRPRRRRARAGSSRSTPARTSSRSSTTRTSPTRSRRRWPRCGRSTAGRLVLVIGAGGDRDTGKRPVMGEIGARLADVLVVTDDNPRTEDPAAIRAAVLAGADEVDDGAEVLEIGDRRDGDPAGRRDGRHGRHRRHRRQGPRDRPGDRRARCTPSTTATSSARRWPSELRRRDRADPGRDRRHRRRRVVDADADPWSSPGRRSSTAATPEPGGLFVAFAGEHVDGHDYAAAAVEGGAAGRARHAGHRRADRPRRRRPGGAAGARPRRCSRGCASRTPGSGSSRSPARRARPRPRTCWPGCSPTPAPTVATAGSFNNELGLPLTVLRADERDPLPRPGDGRARESATSPSCARSRRPTSRWCSTSARPTSASSAPRSRSRWPRASWSRRCRPTGHAVLNVDDPLVAAMADAHHGARLDLRRSAGGRRPPRRASRSTTWAAPPSTSTHGGDDRARRAAPARRAPGDQRRRHRGGGARGRASRSTRSPRACARSTGSRRGGWRCTSAPTASSSSTTPTTPTPTRCAAALETLARMGSGPAGARSRCSARCASSAPPRTRSTGGRPARRPARHRRGRGRRARRPRDPRRARRRAGRRRHDAPRRDRRTRPGSGCARMWPAPTSCWSRRHGPGGSRRVADMLVGDQPVDDVTERRVSA